jgi:hypothetical protein
MAMTNRLLQFRETMVVYCQNYTKHINTRGLTSLWVYKEKKQQATGLEKCIYSTYSP